MPSLDITGAMASSGSSARGCSSLTEHLAKLTERCGSLSARGDPGTGTPAIAVSSKSCAACATRSCITHALQLRTTTLYMNCLNCKTWLSSKLGESARLSKRSHFLMHLSVVQNRCGDRMRRLRARSGILLLVRPPMP